MGSSANQRKGRLWAWFSKAAIRGRRDLDRSLRKLRCETLELRELLSVTLGPVSQSFQTIQVQSASGTVTGTGYTATANLTGSIDYSSPTQGTVSGGLTGTINSGSDAGEPFNASFNNVAQTSGNLSGSVNVTAPNAPTDLTGTSSIAAGSTFDTSQFTSTNTYINWASPSGAAEQWSGIASSTNTTPFGVTLTTPSWDAQLPGQLFFSFNVNNWDPVASSAYDTPVAYVNVRLGNHADHGGQPDRLGSRLLESGQRQRHGFKASRHPQFPRAYRMCHSRSRARAIASRPSLWRRRW